MNKRLIEYDLPLTGTCAARFRRAGMFSETLPHYL